MSDIKQLLTEILSQHGWHEWLEQCCCGWPGERFRETPSGKIQIDATCDEVDEHIADVLLSLPGIAIVELPEPDADDEWDGQAAGWWVGTKIPAGRIPAAILRHTLHPNAAREFAVALLSAANATEHADD